VLASFGPHPSCTAALSSGRGRVAAAGRPGGRRFLLGFFFLLVCAVGCAREPQPHRGPIVLITFDALRADMVGSLGGEAGLTPQLDRLLGESDWAGRAIAPASSAVPALASLVTGLRPWQHQVLGPDRAVLPPDLLTLQEALAATGYSTAAFTGGYWASERFGYGQGFSPLEPFKQGKSAVDALAGLDGGPRFLWIHLPEPETPYILRERVRGRIAGFPGDLPRRIDRVQLEPYFDPARRLPPGRQRRFWALYRLNVAAADERLGRLLGALRASGQWDDTLLVVTSNHGTEFREYGQILQGGSLGRRLIEVPLAIKLPRESAGARRRRHQIVPPAGERVAATRIWATLVEAAGGVAPAAVAPSLWRAGIPPGALSELYQANGTNQFSFVDGDHQLFWEAHFARPEPEYHRARLALVAGFSPPLSEPAPRVMRRLAAAFATAPPLTGRPGLAPPRRWLERWDGSRRGSRVVADPARSADLARRLAAAWNAFLPAERTPAAEQADRPAPAVAAAAEPPSRRERRRDRG
jgi:hypothetical protein